MPRLTRSLRKALRAIAPYDGDENFMPTLASGVSPIEGYPARRLAHDIGELRDLGMLTVVKRNGEVDSFDLTAAGRDYRSNRALDALKVVCRYLFQLLVGASGGLVVLLASRALGQ